MKTILGYVYLNDNYLELIRLANSRTKQLINDAEVLFKLFALDGTTVLQSGAMVYNTDTLSYTAVLPYTLALVKNKSYPFEVTANAGVGKYGRWAGVVKVTE